MNWLNQRLTGTIGMAAIALAMAAPAQALTLYGTTLNSELIQIDPDSGQGTLVSQLALGASPFGLATHGNNLYTYDQVSGTILQLGPLTAKTLNTFDAGIKEDGEGELAFRKDGTGFLTSSFGPTGTLFSFNLAGLSSTQITPRDSLTPSLDGLAFDPTGVLFGLSQNQVDLYTIDPATGASTFIGDPGLDSSFVAGLTFAPNGTLYAAVNNALYTLNPQTAAATLVGNTGFTRVSGLAFFETSSPDPDSGPGTPSEPPVLTPPGGTDPNSIPEPTSVMSLLLLGALGCWSLRLKY
ncbi:hypothetical protein NDA01_08210 [Trichocoleus desertorum AS-A10]|uniref:hypothetical protein n=1 Tax=Trichocoleus desertorum TaxID=1481672 RepID=UPI003296AD33